MTTKTLEVRVEEETLQLLDLLARWQDSSRTKVVQHLLRESARQARLDYAAERYRRGEVTLERAAEIAVISIYDMMAYLRQHGLSGPSQADEMRADVAAMLTRNDRPDLAARMLKD